MAGVSQTNSSNSADADGVTVSFNFTFFAYSTDTIKVYSVLDDVLTPIVAGFTTTINSSFIGGNVLFAVAPADAVGEILIRREVPYTQTTELADLTRYKETAIEQALNILVLQIQQLAEKQSNSLQYNETAGVTDATIEEPVDTAVLQFDGTTGRVKAGPTAAQIAGAEADAIAVETDLASVETDLAAVETDLSAVEADLLAVETDLAAVETDLAAVETDLAATEADIITTAADKAATEADVTATGADKTATEADVVLTEADLAAVETDLLATEGDATATAADKTATEADATATAADKTATEADLTAVEADLSAVETDLSAVETDLAAVETDLGAVETDLAAVEADLATIQNRSIVDESGSQTFALVDADTIQRYTGGGGHTWTIPAEGTVAFADGAEIVIHNDTAFDLTLTAAATVTCGGATAGSVTIPARSGAMIKNRTGNAWLHFGTTAAEWA